MWGSPQATPSQRRTAQPPAAPLAVAPALCGQRGRLDAAPHLGCLLAGELGLRLRRVGSGRRLPFADGEGVLSGWMATHAAVCWMTHPRPWELEHLLVARLDLPLNLYDNARHPFYPHLRGVRAAARATARTLPVWVSSAGTGAAAG
jgi:hypothetical protein